MVQEIEQIIYYNDIPLEDVLDRLVDRRVLEVSYQDLFGLYFERVKLKCDPSVNGNIPMEYMPEWFLLIEDGFEVEGKSMSITGGVLLTYIFARNHARFIFSNGRIDVRLDREGHIKDKWVFSPEKNLYLA